MNTVYISTFMSRTQNVGQDVIIVQQFLINSLGKFQNSETWKRHYDIRILYVMK
jgi:hypothetical protein